MGIIEALAICEYWRTRSQDIDPMPDEGIIWAQARAIVADMADTTMMKLKRPPPPAKVVRQWSGC